MEARRLHQGRDTIPEAAPVLITFNDKILTLQYEGSGKHAGVLISETLFRLVRQCAVTLAATLSKAKGNSLDQAQLSYNSFAAHSLRIVVYGLLSEKDKVTHILDGGELFLQQPEASEYDRRVRYFNPMYLLRPGEEMPRIDGTSTTAARGQVVASSHEAMLREAEWSRVLNIFDEASGPNPGTLVDVKQSCRIVTELKEYKTPRSPVDLRAN